MCSFFDQVVYNHSIVRNLDYIVILTIVALLFLGGKHIHTHTHIYICIYMY
jgi:hypothetical protein